MISCILSKPTSQRGITPYVAWRTIVIYIRVTNSHSCQYLALHVFVFIYYYKITTRLHLLSLHIPRGYLMGRVYVLKHMANIMCHVNTLHLLIGNMWISPICQNVIGKTLDLKMKNKIKCQTDFGTLIIIWNNCARPAIKLQYSCLEVPCHLSNFGIFFQIS